MPTATKLLIPLIDSHLLASNSVHNRRDFFDRFPVRVTNNMAVNLKRGSGVRVPKLPLCDLRRRTGVEQERCVCVTERMEAAPWNPECIENCPEVVFHDFV